MLQRRKKSQKMFSNNIGCDRNRTVIEQKSILRVRGDPKCSSLQRGLRNMATCSTDNQSIKQKASIRH